MGTMQALMSIALQCMAAEQSAVEVDGILSDWQDVSATSLGGGMRARCLADGAKVYLMVDGLPGSRGELWMREDRIRLAPNTSGGMVRGGSPGAARGGYRYRVIRRPKGLAIEAELELEFVERVLEIEIRGATRTRLRLDTGEEARAILAFREHIHSEQTRPDFDARAEFGFAPGLERIIRFGKYVALVTDEYTYFELPIKTAGDLRGFELRSCGRETAVVARYIERGSGGERELLAAYTLAGSSWRRIFAAEVSKRVPSPAGVRALETRASWTKRRGRDELELEALPARGFDARTYLETPATDVIPILLPWEKRNRARYRLSVDGYEEVD